MGRVLTFQFGSSPLSTKKSVRGRGASMGRTFFRSWVYLCAVVVACLIFCGPASAQVVTGSVSGTVVDPSGAAVPDAKVSAHSRATGFNAEGQTDRSGDFKLAQLPVGPVDVQISKTGFR